MNALGARTAAAVRAHRDVLIGLVAAMVLAAAGSAHLAFVTAPYGWDEPAHVGYVLSLRDGDLPTVDTPIPAEGRSAELEFAASRSSRWFNPDVYVANNPPFVHASNIPAAFASLRADVPAGPLLGVRLMGALSAAIALVFTYLLCWELVRDRLTALTAAGLQAGLIAVAVVTAYASLDGQALASSTAVAWALVRALRRRRVPDATVLGVACAGAAAVRPMSLVFAVAAGVLGFAVLARALPRRTWPGLLVRLAVPTLVLVGWFYALNVVRYGDPTASDALFEKFSMRPKDTGWWSFLASERSLIDPLGYMLHHVYGVPRLFAVTDAARRTAWAALGVLAVAILLSARRTRAGRATVDRTAGMPDDGRPAGPIAWGALALLSLVPVLLLTAHTLGGGGPHPRYIMSILPILCCAAASLAAAIHRFVPAVVVAAWSAWYLSRLVDLGDARAAAATAQPGAPLGTTLTGSTVDDAAVALAGLGAAVTVVSLAWLARQRTHSPSDVPPPVEVPVAAPPRLAPVAAGGPRSGGTGDERDPRRSSVPTDR